MKVQFTKSLAKDHPNVREMVVVVSGIDNTSHPDHSFQYLCREMDEVRKNFVEYSQKEHELSNNIWQRKFVELGFNEKKVKPSHIALLNRVVLDRVDLPNINPIVNIINALQLKYNMPIGAHDLDKIEGDITVGENSTNLTFMSRDKKNNEIEISSDE